LLIQTQNVTNELLLLKIKGFSYHLRELWFAFERITVKNWSGRRVANRCATFKQAGKVRLELTLLVRAVDEQWLDFVSLALVAQFADTFKRHIQIVLL